MEFWNIIEEFKWMYILVTMGVAVMLLLAFVVPVTWQIRGFFACFPLGLMLLNHFVMPLVLNPRLMSFAFCNDKNCDSGD
jgi:hypothetical protein